MGNEKIKALRPMSKNGAGIELALSAVIFGLLGFWLDKKMNTTPALFIGFFIFGFLGSAFSLYYRFKEQMAQLDRDAEVGDNP